MSNIFGNSTGTFGAQQQQQQQPAAPSLFGNPAPQQPAPSLFGNPTAPQQSAPNLFGNPAAQQPAPSLFGNPAPQQPAPGLFGNPAPQQSAPNLFGNPTQQQSAPNLFGNPAPQQPAPNLFGNPAPQQSASSLFGNTVPQQPAPNLFGNTAPQQPAPSLFGNTAPQQPAPGLFGNTTQQSTSSFFGNPAPQQNTTAPSLFGNQSQGGGILGQQQQPQNAQPAQQSSNFFAQPSQQQQQQQRLLFGPTLNQSNNSLFGGGTTTSGTSTLLPNQNSLLSTRSTTLPVQQQDPQAQFAALTQKIESIAQGWNANSPQCRFQHYFYNLVDPNQVSLYIRPPNVNDALWQKAVRENPDPTCLVPVIANGFDDLQQRIAAQTQQAAAHQEKLKELKTRISTLTQRHDVSNAPRMQRATAQQAQLTHRVLKLVQHLHLLIPALRSSAIRPEEEALRAKLEEIDEEMRKAGGGARMRGKLNELWALVGAMHAARERGRKGVGADTGTGANVGWAVVDEEGLAQIAQILSDQQTGLAHLTKILQRDLKDLNIVQGTGGNPGQGEDHPDQSTLFRAVGALRGSVRR